MRSKLLAYFNNKSISLAWILSICFTGGTYAFSVEKSDLKAIPHYYSTAASKDFFDMLLNLIGSIHKHDPHVESIFVYDIGLTLEQQKKLLTIEKVLLCEIEEKTSATLKPFSYEGQPIKKIGAYSWKPIAIKQTLEQQPYCFWLDAGLELAGPMDEIFEYLLEAGYFLHNRAGPYHGNLNRMLNPFARAQFMVTQQELSKTGLEAGFMGITRNVLDSFVLPAYEAAEDIRNFLDFGVVGRRHDGAIFSLFAIRNGLTIHQHSCEPLILTTSSYKTYQFQYCNYPVANDAHPNVRKAPTRFDGIIHHYDNIRYKEDNETA